MHIKQTHIDPLMQELSLYKRWRYGKRSERLTPAQASPLEDRHGGYRRGSQRAARGGIRQACAA